MHSYYLIGEPLGEYHKIETMKKTLNIYISAYQTIISLHVTPDDGLISRNIYIKCFFLLFQFCDTYLKVPLISMNTYHLELMPESYNLQSLFFSLYNNDFNTVNE